MTSRLAAPLLAPTATCAATSVAPVVAWDGCPSGRPLFTDESGPRI